MNTGINQLKTLTKDVSCKCECTFESKIDNSSQI